MDDACIDDLTDLARAPTAVHLRRQKHLQQDPAVYPRVGLQAVGLPAAPRATQSTTTLA